MRRNEQDTTAPTVSKILGSPNSRTGLCVTPVLAESKSHNHPQVSLDLAYCSSQGKKKMQEFLEKIKLRLQLY